MWFFLVDVGLVVRYVLSLPIQSEKVPQPYKKASFMCISTVSEGVNEHLGNGIFFRVHLLPAWALMKRLMKRQNRGDEW